MKTGKKFTALLITFCLALTLLPTVGPAARAEGNVISASTEKDGVRKAVEQASPGDIIEINGSGHVNDNQSNGEPWIIDKNITIRGKNPGDMLLLWAGGIVLGADVTFENIKLSFANPIRNEIIANGYTLTLDGVTRDTSAQEIHLFCGGLTNSNHSVPAPGTRGGTIIIRNCSGLGNIYAGSLSGGVGTNSFDLPAAVRIESGGPGSVGKLYACGALETYDDPNQMLNPDYRVDPPSPSHKMYPVTGPVEFHLYHTAASEVDGATGGSRDAAVFYTGSEYPNSSLTLNNIASLSLAGGGMLSPKAGSSFHADMDLSVPSGTALGLADLGAAPVIHSFTGGGTLVLGASQTLEIQGTVSGTTTIGVGRIQNGVSDPVTLDYPYIIAPQSTESSFRLAKLNPPQQSAVLSCGAGGIWSVTNPSAGDKILVGSFSMADAAVSSSDTEVTLPLDVSYAPNSAPVSYLDFVPLGITINNSDARLSTDEEGSNIYNWGSYTLTLQVIGDELSITGDGADGAIAPGVYRITISIPREYTAADKLLSATAVLTVNAPGTAPISVPIPTAKTGLTYTGEEQAGVAEGTGYTLTGHRATNAGSYTATAALKSGYQWADGTTESKAVAWRIDRAAGPAAPSGLGACAPTTENGTDGKLTGTTSAMEYAADSGFTAPKPCTDGETTGLSTGTYYIRIKGTENYAPGAETTVAVPAYSGSTGGGSTGGGSSEPSPGAVNRITASQITAAKSGDVVNVTLTAEHAVVDGSVFTALAGRDVTLSVKIGTAIWRIQGKDLPAQLTGSSLNFGVETTASVPQELREQLPSGDALLLSLAHDGPCGFPLTLSLEVGRENAGRWANLYYCPEDGVPSLVHAVQVGGGGRAAFPFTHASDYVVILDSKSHLSTPADPKPNA